MRKRLFNISFLALLLALGWPARVHAAAMSGAAASASQDRDDWTAPPDDYNDARRTGFHDGIDAARRDAYDHRQADADDHHQFRHPPVRGEEMRDQYREGFRAGYQRAQQQMMNGGSGDHDRDHDHDQDGGYR